ncbi:sensor histidine kinase [Alkaliphilus hydrothermalis]|uniref:Sensor histidine kinase regulating citrate/malate metabolism n=1 Tax=Alkaliphilus hydrothermalis TaxID=1482730 RepID=A0ABS2NTX9_9FIRM|nr:GHKL domain-containing protein [Alkaliphilus hydrothermalis]MBM7616405.1 sensor histidine kinase regulating citrate/malate metabolism [Alkaliphilus hydrothermalis]
MKKNKLQIGSLVGQILILLLVVIVYSKQLGVEGTNRSYYSLICVIILSMVNTYILFRILQSGTKEKELDMIKSDLRNTEVLIDLLRQQGHDHINHIQTVTSMLILEEYTVAQEYLQGIANNYRFTGHFLRLGNPTLTALVNTKKELANQKGVEFIVERYCRVKLKNINPWDLASIICNLLENALEYVLSHGNLSQRIHFHLEHRVDLKGYIFKISNPYQEENQDLQAFFKQGFSSKASSGRGYGLSIVKNLVDQYNGKIEVYKDGENITFEVELRD